MSDWSRALSASSSTGAADPSTEDSNPVGHRGLQMEENLSFELGRDGIAGVDLPEVPPVVDRLGGLNRADPIGLPGLSEPEVVRHFTRLSQKNYAIDAGPYPLGSCTMKHNPRVNERLARLPGFADLHPLQPVSTVQGALAVLHQLSEALQRLTGMPVVALTPAAGAHGELCGLMTIRAALDERDGLPPAADGTGKPGRPRRRRVLVPESAHGTNPATAAAVGYQVEAVPANDRGRIDVAAFRDRLSEDVAAVMLTNPNTCGLFEDEILEIAAGIHEIGGFLYADGANLNAILGRVRISDLGIDCMHINLHKTFSTPHGGGGPGAGPVVLSAALAPYAPVPWLVFKENDGAFSVQETTDGIAAHSFGRLKAYHGQMGMFVRALAYILSMGGDGLRQASGDAVLAANYILASVQDVMSASFEGPCMHECLLDDRFLKDSGVTTLDFAKALIDEGFHPMTMYFPLVVPGAMLIEPTESESRESLDQLIAALRRLTARAQEPEAAAWFQEAPRLTPRRRLDETLAARKPVLRWETSD